MWSWENNNKKRINVKSSRRRLSIYENLMLYKMMMKIKYKIKIKCFLSIKHNIVPFANSQEAEKSNDIFKNE